MQWEKQDIEKLASLRTGKLVGDDVGTIFLVPQQGKRSDPGRDRSLRSGHGGDAVIACGRLHLVSPSVNVARDIEFVAQRVCIWLLTLVEMHTWTILHQLNCHLILTSDTLKHMNDAL